ncbi:MAG: NAD(P)/FAD-dependent oxidoreductase [Henriciella sp.]
MGKPLDIAIAGAGIGGLAAAILLARQGHKVRIFDQFDAPQPVGSGLMLQRTGLAVLDELGLRPKIDALGSRIDRLWGLTTPSMRPVLDVRYAELNPDLYGLGVQRSMLFNHLLEAAKDSACELTPSTRLIDADAEAGTFSTAQKTIGSFDLVIDALGVNSPLTRTPKHDLPYGALWATLPWPEAGPFDAAALEQRYEKASKMTGVMASGKAHENAPLSLTYFWSIRSDQEANWRTGSLEAWKAEATALWPETAELLNLISHQSDMTFARYRHRTHPDPVSGSRLIHLGDAWHAASPQLGQGANMALLDAWAIAKALSEKADQGEALSYYKSLRHSHVKLYQLMTWLFTPVYQGDSQILPWLRDWLAAPLSKVWPAPKLLSAMVSGQIWAPLRRLDLETD